MDFISLIGGLIIIIVGATILTDGSVALAARFRVPEFIVGLTVIAVGTSMPELAVSLLSALNGSSDMAIGNVVGSNICNIFAILGLSALLSPITFTQSNVRRDIPICIAASVAFVLVTMFDHKIGRIEGLVLLIAYIAMIIYSVRSDRAATTNNADDGDSTKVMPIWRMVVYIVVGLAALILGGEFCVDSATALARRFGVSEATIAITLVAGGTSLPELAASLASIFKGKASMALGNVLGSNIANILLILGVCSTAVPLTMGNIEMTDVYIVLSAAVAVMLTAYIIGRNKITRVEGALFLLCYIGYVYTLI